LEQRLGRGLKPGMIACHTCDNRWCVNPEHIYEGTHATNTADRWRAGTAYHAEGTKNGHAKVTEEEVKMIRFLQENGVGYNVLGKMFGLSKPALSAIKHRKNWTHI
jgi:hypothetical protein